MAKHQLIDSEIANAFSEIQYLIRVIYSSNIKEEQNRALNQLWNTTSYLKLLVKLLQYERKTSFFQPLPTNTIYPNYTRNLSVITEPPGMGNPQDANPNVLTLTREQLMQFTGMNGKPAYVAVNGIIYDVTNNAAWSLASHFGLTAGRDLTAEFASCHSGQQWILAQLKPIGRLLQ
jgi:membrane-associated progesterone receptor component